MLQSVISPRSRCFFLMLPVHGGWNYCVMTSLAKLHFFFMNYEDT